MVFCRQLFKICLQHYTNHFGLHTVAKEREDSKINGITPRGRTSETSLLMNTSWSVANNHIL